MSKHFSNSSQGDRGARWAQGGLEVDTRATDNTDKHLDPNGAPRLRRLTENNDMYLHEKEIHIEERERGIDSPSTMSSPVDGGTLGGATMVPETPRSPEKPYLHENNSEKPILYNSDVKARPPMTVTSEQPPEPAPRKICGIRRRNFWIIFAVILATIITAAIIGGAIAGTKQKSAVTPTPSNVPPAPAASTSTPTPTIEIPLLSQDVIADSPINVVSYTNPGAPTPEQKQTFRIYYQSVIGNVKEAISDAMGPWQLPRPLFTDAINNTGLASLTWENLTDGEISGSIYYIDQKFNLQEKRKKFSDKLLWEPGTLNPILRLTARGSVATEDNASDDPKNDWDGYRIAAVYSRKFAGGPQARVFYRSQNFNDSTEIQELKWDHTADTWSKGASFNDAWPTSHFAASIDEETNILRLFFSVSGKTLQEYWTDITTPETPYQKGLTIPNYLPHHNVDISSVSLNGTTYLYHYSPFAKALRETRITGPPNNETYTKAESLVIAPSNMTFEGQNATYQPFVAQKTNVVDLDPSLFVFWADTQVGLNATSTTEGGYKMINQVRRDRNAKGWGSDPKIFNIPLGDENAQPWVPEF